MKYELPAFDSVINFGMSILGHYRNKGEKRALTEGIQTKIPCPVPSFEGIIMDDNIPDKLSPDCFEFHMSKGRNPLNVIVTIIVQMGWFCGYRHALNANQEMIERGEEMYNRRWLELLSSLSDDELEELYRLHFNRYEGPHPSIEQIMHLIETKA